MMVASFLDESKSAANAVSAPLDVAVVGGGLVGRLMAWRLAREGLRVALFERGDPHGRTAAAWVAAAMLAPLAESAVAEPLLVDLGAASLDRWPQWLSELPEPVFFQRNGTLVVWHAADHADAALFQRRVIANSASSRFVNAYSRENGMIALDGRALAEEEPALAGRFRQGWLMPGEGQLDNRQLLAALDVALSDLGVPIHAGQSIEEDNWPAAGVTVDCRGLGAKRALAGLRGIRGEVIRVDAPGIGLTRPVRLLHPRYPIYIAPKENDRYVIGATEIESEDASAMSVRSALELLSAAFSIHPGFGEARILELNTQCRPTLADHRPAIMLETRAAACRVSVNGLYRHGFMIAPEVVSEAVGLVMACCHRQNPVNTVEGTEGLLRDWREKSPWPDLYTTSTS